MYCMMPCISLMCAYEKYCTNEPFVINHYSHYYLWAEITCVSGIWRVIHCLKLATDDDTPLYFCQEFKYSTECVG
jgi:hypothetical protein